MKHHDTMERWIPGLGLAIWGLTMIWASTLLAQGGEPEPVPADDAMLESVRPGINERWKSGEVGELVGMLERDGREIFENRVAIADLLAPPPGMRLADVGAGSGFMVEEFAKRVGAEGKVYGVDINGEMMARLAERADSAGLTQVETVTCTETSVELPEASVDLVFLADTYHHFEYPAQSLESIHRALVPGGRLVILDFERIVGESSDWVLEHVRLGKDEVIEEVGNHGFELVGDLEAPFLSENYAIEFRRTDD